MERYISKAPKLDAYQKEVLTILMEECGEVIQIASKMLRFGMDKNPNTGVSNEANIGFEIGDLLYMIDIALWAGLFRQEAVFEGRRRKRARLMYYLQCDSPSSSSAVVEKSLSDI